MSSPRAAQDTRAQEHPEGSVDHSVVPPGAAGKERGAGHSKATSKARDEAPGARRIDPSGGPWTLPGRRCLSRTCPPARPSRHASPDIVHDPQSEPLNLQDALVEETLELPVQDGPDPGGGAGPALDDDGADDAPPPVLRSLRWYVHGLF